MISCRRAAELISQRLDTDESTGQQIVLGIHLMVCGKCRTFRQQLVQVNDATGEFLRSDALPDDGTDLPADSRARIQNRLSTDTKS